MEKEKSFYEIMRERNMEDAKNLPVSPNEIGQHILWLKMAAIERIEKLDNRVDDAICTFRAGKPGDESARFGFTEPYVNLLMHYAYEAGKKRATEDLTRSFTESTKNMKSAIDSIISALDNNDLLPYNEDNY